MRMCCALSVYWGKAMESLSKKELEPCLPLQSPTVEELQRIGRFPFSEDLGGHIQDFEVDAGDVYRQRKYLNCLSSKGDRFVGCPVTVIRNV